MNLLAKGINIFILLVSLMEEGPFDFKDVGNGGESKLATLPVRCSVLLFHTRIIKHKVERCSVLIIWLCLERSERNGNKYENKNNY